MSPSLPHEEAQLPSDVLEPKQDVPREDRLFWCTWDTTDPLVNRNIVQATTDGAVTLPRWCKDFLDEIEEQLRNPPKPDFVFGYPLSAQIRKKGEVRPAFVALSYAPEFDRVKKTIKKAAKKRNFKCEITGDVAVRVPILDEIWHGIRHADVFVADTTGTNPNVMFELGLATALGKEIILISQDREMPFDVRGWQKIPYSKTESGLRELLKDLKKAFRGVSARYPHEGPEPRF